MDSISLLTDEQAINAVKLFYDFAPPELWEDGKKPAPERVEKVAAALVEYASADDKPVIAALLDDDKKELMGARSEVCRMLLSQLRQSPTFLPIVDRAIETACQPRAGIEPITGAFIVVILLATTKVEVEYTPDGKLKKIVVEPGRGVVEIIEALRLSELLEKLPPVIKALPEEVLGDLVKIFTRG